jgi:2-alkyl-3-oxoalkanoate reductase
MKTLVIGGGGFLGQYIVEQLLERGDSVSSLARNDYPHLRKMGVRVLRGDLEDEQAVSKACAGMEVVFLVAANDSMWGPWKAFYGPNVLGARHVIKACKTHKVPKLIYTSTPSTVFANKPLEGCDESLPYPQKPESHYTKSKAMAEQLVLAANGEDLLTCALRPHLIFGPRDPHLLIKLIELGLKQKMFQVGDGAIKYDFTFVEDAARTHLLAADKLIRGSPVAGSVYFITQNEPVIFYPWLNALYEKLGIPPIKKRLSLPVARFIGAVLETIRFSLPVVTLPPFTRFLASKLAMSSYYDISKAQHDLGYEPQHTMDEALEKTLPYLREHFKL